MLLLEAFQAGLSWECVLNKRRVYLDYMKNPYTSEMAKQKVLDLAARKRIVEENENAIFVSIHMNSFPDARYSGLTVYYSENTPESFEIAEYLRKDVVTLLQPNNNRVLKPGGNIYLLKRAACPAILVECGFVSNPEECALLSTEEYRQRLSFVIYSSLSSNLSGN